MRLLPMNGGLPTMKVGLGPVGGAGVGVVEDLDAGLRVGDGLAGDRVADGGDAVPAGDGAAFGVDARGGGVPGEDGVAVLDVVEVAQHRLGGGGAAVGAVVPLQVADPEHQLGDGGGPGVELDAEELVRVDGVAFEAEGGLASRPSP